jgi:plastocyanin
MVGAWPFHDHSRRMAESINRGLFGGIIVRPRQHRIPLLEPVLPPILQEILREPRRLPPPGDPRLEGLRDSLTEWALQEHVHPFPHPPAVIEVPLFFHLMAGTGGVPAFDSGPIAAAAPPFEVAFGAEGTFGYHCSIHPNMQAKVTVMAGGPSLATVDILSSPDMKFDPPTVTVTPGGKVRWTNIGPLTHTVTEDAAGLPSFCFNGRSFVGNTPTILAHAGQRIRWYVFNLDLREIWHNYHPHGQRWRFANETIDVRSISPAESFELETTAPPVLLLPPDIEKGQDPQHRPRGAKEYRIRGDFHFHCHIDMHMDQGLAGLVRSQQVLWLTPKQADQLAMETGLPLDPG